MVGALKALGVELEERWEQAEMVVHGCAGRFPVEGAELFLGNAGTAMRSVLRTRRRGHTPAGLSCLHGLLVCARWRCGSTCMLGPRIMHCSQITHTSFSPIAQALDRGGSGGGAGDVCAGRRGAHAGAPHPGPGGGPGAAGGEGGVHAGHRLPASDRPGGGPALRDGERARPRVLGHD